MPYTRSRFMSRDRMRGWQLSIRAPDRAKKVKAILREGGFDGVRAAEGELMRREKRKRSNPT
jgi:hypothetical protein